jgi:hypothetical protein
MHTPSVDEHGARAALPMVAALFRAGKAEPLAQHVEQRGRGSNARQAFDAVDQNQRARVATASTSCTSAATPKRSASIASLVTLSTGYDEGYRA